MTNTEHLTNRQPEHTTERELAWSIRSVADSPARSRLRPLATKPKSPDCAHLAPPGSTLNAASHCFQLMIVPTRCGQANGAV